MRSAWSSRRVVAGAFAGLAVALILVPKATAADDTTNLPSATDAATAAVTTTATDATTAAANDATGAAATGAAATGAAATGATDTVAAGATDTTGAVTGTVGAVTGAAQQTVTAVTAPPDTAAAPPAANPVTTTTTPPPPDSGDATAGTGTPTAKDPTTPKDPNAKDDKGGAKDTTSKDGADKGGAKDTTGKNNGTTAPGDTSTPTKTTTPSGNEQTAATPPPAQSTPVTTQPPPPPAPAAPSVVPLAPPPDPGVAQVRLAPPPLAFPAGLSFFGSDPTTIRHVGFAARWAGTSSDLTSSHEAPGVTTLFATPVAGAPTVPTGTPAAPMYVADSKSKAPRHATASQARPTKAPPTGGVDDERAPLSPAAPPGHGVVAGSVASSGSGAAPVMFFAILLGVLAYAAQELRRHRFRLVVVDLDGIVSPQQRPG